MAVQEVVCELFSNETPANRENNRDFEFSTRVSGAEDAAPSTSAGILGLQRSGSEQGIDPEITGTNSAIDTGMESTSPKSKP